MTKRAKEKLIEMIEEVSWASFDYGNAHGWQCCNRAPIELVEKKWKERNIIRDNLIKKIRRLK